jgi:hypothetical protein
MIPDLKTCCLILCLILAGAMTSSTALGGEEIRFSRDVLPLLSDRCFHCHGPDPMTREAGLRLDLREEAVKDRDGTIAINPGKPDESELLARIVSHDDDLRMPPASSHRKPLSERDIAILRQWIEEGAQWGRHWSFEKPTCPDVPVSNAHPIDAFVQKRLAQAMLQPSLMADRGTLVRRLYFDLTGMLPSVEEFDATMADRSENAYEKLVDRLLASPQFGERMAMWWLDAARYSDTDGFQIDAERENWPWRDWVVQSFHENKPFDRFIVEQFAGDLLENATDEQRLATCFHRNHMTNGEGGRDPEESRIDYVIDRVNTTGTVFLGLTLGCTQCHSHKFDPIEHRDYYELAAFFDSIDEDGRAGMSAKPYLKYRSPLAESVYEQAKDFKEACQKEREAARELAVREFDGWLTEVVKTLPMSFETWKSIKRPELSSLHGTQFEISPDGIVQTKGVHPHHEDYRLTFTLPAVVKRLTGVRLEVLTDPSHTDSRWSRGKSGEFILSNVKLSVARVGSSQVREIEMNDAFSDYEAERGKTETGYNSVQNLLNDDPRNGWSSIGAKDMSKMSVVIRLTEPLRLADDERLTLTLMHRSTPGDGNIGRFRLLVTDQAGLPVESLSPSPFEEFVNAARAEVADAEGAPVTWSLSQLDPQLRERLLEQYLIDHEGYQASKDRLERATQQLKETEKSRREQSVMVLSEKSQPRTSYVLERGVWDAKGEVVHPALLDQFLEWPTNDRPTRLDLANWIVSRENPLTSRVIVNHLWQLVFGQGLVRTPGDFGLQGEQPTHPELLDWLAVEFMEHDWDVKYLIKLMVMSRTYQQSSDLSGALLASDPENRLLARANRYRLPAWMLRDAALKASGLLNSTLGGPPVKPWQPDGVWAEITMGRFDYKPNLGPSQYRRSLYAFWRRSSSPTFLFDNAERRVCEVAPKLTNTPLQALTLWNDVTYLEASRVLAETAVASESKELETLARALLQRQLSADEQEIFSSLQQETSEYYRQHADEAVAFTSIGQRPALSQDAAPGIASWMVVASSMLSLDEAITHE